VATIRVVLVDDVVEVRRLLRLFIERQAGDAKIVAEGTTGRHAIELAQEHHPDIVILDHQMPDLSGMDALPEIRAASPGTRVLMFTSSNLDLTDDRRMPDAHAQKLDGLAGFSHAFDVCVAKLTRNVLI
jgi:DNA-binding NarL/FixJ family response regulator